MMSRKLLSKYRTLSFTASGFLVLWYFFDANISNISLLKDLGLEKQIAAYILVFLIMFGAIESFIEYSKEINKQWQSNLQMLIVLIFAIASIIISYPKLTENTFLHATRRIDIIVPILSAIVTSIAALELNYSINMTLIFYRLRKTIHPALIAFLALPLALIAFGFMSTAFFSGEGYADAFPIRYIVFLIFFLLSFLILSEKKDIFSKEVLKTLKRTSESLDREVETSEAVSSLRKTIYPIKNKTHKKIMRAIQGDAAERKKSTLTQISTLKEIDFNPVDEHCIPNVDDASDDEPVLRIEVLNKNTKEIIEQTDIKYKYIILACREIPRSQLDNDERAFLNLVASKAHSIQLLNEGDPNELMLNYSASDKYLSDLKELFNTRKPDINHVASNGWTALLISVANGEVRTAKYLLQKASAPNLATKHGAAPLHFASKYGNKSLCKLLLDYHADVNQQDIDGATPLMKAAELGHSAIVKLLVQYGANIQLSDNKDQTAFAYATIGNHGEICRYLKKSEMERKG